MNERIETKRLELTGKFAGMWVEIRSNPPMRVYKEFQSGDLDRVMGALATMTRSSNRTDDDDQPIDLSKVEGWLEVSDKFIAEVADRLKDAMQPPKVTQNGSTTPTPTEEKPSPPDTTK